MIEESINLMIKFITSAICLYCAIGMLYGYAKTKSNLRLAIAVLYVSILVTPMLFALNVLIDIDFNAIYVTSLSFGVLTGIALVYITKTIYFGDNKKYSTLSNVYIITLIAIGILTIISMILSLSDLILALLLIYSSLIFSIYITEIYSTYKISKFVEDPTQKGYVINMILMYIFLTLFLIIGIFTVDMEGEINHIIEIINGLVLFTAVFFSYKAFIIPIKKRLQESTAH